MAIRTAAVSLLLFIVACDEPAESGAAAGGKAPAVAGAAAGDVAVRPAAPPAVRDTPPTAEAVGLDDRATYSGCLRGCDDVKVAHADKAACRMNCEKPASPVPGPAAATVVSADPVEYVVACIGRCDSDGKRSEACTSACKRDVAALPATPSADVLDTLGTCLDACHGKQVSDTNRATCGLNCAQAARVAGPAPAAAVKR